MANQKHFAVREKERKSGFMDPSAKKADLDLQRGMMAGETERREREPDAGRQRFSLSLCRFLRVFSYERSLNDGARPSVETGLNPTRYPRSRRARVPTAARARARSELNQDDGDRKAL